MSEEDLRHKLPLAASSGQLWRQSFVWKLALFGAAVCTLLLLVGLPWDSNSLTASSAPPAQQSSVTTQPVTAAATQKQPSTTERGSRAADGTVGQSLPVEQNVAAQPPTLKIQDPSQEALSSQIADADQNCGSGGPMRVFLNPPPQVEGQIEGFLSDAEAMSLIPKSEQSANGQIDPAYVHNRRAIFHPSNAPPNVRIPILVPDGMDVYVGENVQMVGGHASPKLACHYIPNLIVADVPRQ